MLSNSNPSIQFTTTTMCVTLIICTLLIANSHLSMATDYDVGGGGGGGGGGSDYGAGGDVVNGDLASNSDDIYETVMLQQDMEEHEKTRKILLEDVTTMGEKMEDLGQSEEDKRKGEHGGPIIPTASPQSLKAIRTAARINKMYPAEALAPSLMLPPATAQPSPPQLATKTLIPTYVRSAPRTELNFPRTIIGGTVSVEEADANVSTSDYVNEEEESEHENTGHTVEPIGAQKRNDIDDPIAMKLYDHDERAAHAHDDNAIKDQQTTPPAQQQLQQRQHQPREQQHHHHQQHRHQHQHQLPDAPVPRNINQLHLNNSGEDDDDDEGVEEEYYDDDLQDNSYEAQNLHQQKSAAPSAAATTPTLTAAPTPTPITASMPAVHAPAHRVGLAAMLPQHQVIMNVARAQPFDATQARGSSGIDWTTSDVPLMTFTTTTTTAPITPRMPATAAPTTNHNSFHALTPGNTATSTTTTTSVITTNAAATGFGIESSSAAATTMTPTMITTKTTKIKTAKTPITITTMRPTGKQGKQIPIPRGRKLLPHEQLRNYIEDAYIRMPLAVIVDPTADALDKTKALWREALRTNLNIKIVLVSLNASGIPAAYNFNNTRQFLAGLNSIKVHDGGNSFVGILHASELVPYDSAVFISTAVIPPHTELVQDAAITLLKKRIRLFLIWYGERSLSENETQDAVGGILGEVAIRSGGEVLHLVGSENSQELEGSTLTLVADAYVGAQDIDIPVDTTLSSLHVKIDAAMRTATLETPNGDINLKKLVKFKSLVLTNGTDDQRLDAYVPLNKLRKVAVYKLKMIPESLSDEYSVFVRAERKSDLFLDNLIKHFDSILMQNRGSYPLRLKDISLSVLPKVNSDKAFHITNVPKTHSNLRFPNNEELEDEIENSDPKSDQIPKHEVETFSETEIHNNQPEIPTNQNTTMLTNMVNLKTTYNGIARTEATALLQRDVTKIEIGLQSQLLLAPGALGTIQFELTNTRTEPIYHSIQVVDERRFLLRLNPQNVFLRAGEMATVAVTVLIPNGTPQGTIDKITFTCHGGGTASLSLNLKVLSATTGIDAQDTTAPSILWNFGSRCENKDTDSSTCAERFWTLDITAQDWQTGIMRLQTIPSAGLLYRNSYTVGSTEPLKATYIATCCEPKVAITAFDIVGNQRSYNVDVRDVVLTEASIAAIVLGALLLLLLIILSIWGIVWCCRKRKVTLDLPTYRSHSRRSID